MTKTIHPVILCGGSGTRLWPLSTPERPKQFLALTSDKTMLQETAERFKADTETQVSFSTPIVIGSARHEALLKQTLPEAYKILEPFGRNSAPAVAAACLACAPEDLLLICPADHSIRNVPAFHAAIMEAVAAGENGQIATFGIKPTRPATEYGYIRATKASELNETVSVEEFVEKPPLQDAKAYLAAGNYYWNAGIFMFRVDTMLAALERYAPKVLDGVRSAFGKRDATITRLEPIAFHRTPSISIDYAVMEKAKTVVTIPVDMDWDDVGGYPALHGLLTKTETENHICGPAIVRESSGLYVRSEGPMIAVSGVQDLAIVATRDEVMIAPTYDAAAVKALGAEVQSRGRQFGLSPEIIDRARNWLWAAFDVWSEKAWDAVQGGFVEQLSMDGVPDVTADRRVRVQARQVFSFAKAIEMGWPGTDKARRLVDQGVAYINDRLRHPDGGWVHTVRPDGTPIDDRRDLYDHAFMILAGATAYRITGNETALKIADDAIAFIDSELKDASHGGWFEAKPDVLPRRANPHMHLLEAMMAYYAATGAKHALDRAAECVRLFETKFFNPANNVMAEFFTTDWCLDGSQNETVFEPGHHYEWATLLYQYEKLTGHDTGSWRRRLIKRADESGINSETGFAHNLVQADDVVLNSGSRLWHQLERLRAVAYHPEIEFDFTTATMFASIQEIFLEAGPPGGWVDEISQTGKRSTNSVPASMLYHIVTSFDLFINAD